MTQAQLHAALAEAAEAEYAAFSSKLLGGAQKPLLGVRLPALRVLAKEIARSDGWVDYLAAAPRDYFEEIMLRGMIIGAVRISPEERISRIQAFIPEIDSWSICDSFCAGLKFTAKNRETVFSFVRPYCGSKKEFEARFGYVMLLDFFLTEEYIDAVLSLVSSFSHPAYYARMAVAWLLATALAKFPSQAMHCLKTAPLDDFTYRKTIQKALESFRVPPALKQELRELRAQNAK